MSANLYTTMPPPPRRHPLATAANHYAVNQPQQRAHHPQAPPSAPVTKPQAPPTKQGQELPLPRQNAKVTPPSPPKIIFDDVRSIEFMRVGMLGEGGFARVYEIQDARRQRSACKVVTKSSVKTKKAKTKLWAEIKIHKALNHPNIVRFQECFEDEEHVYMTLELCHNGSLMDMLRRRRRFTEPEARFFMVQLIGACHYMHANQVIHRDLKLGNILLDRNMNVKVADFGLAALIENPGERKKTICGTPNYIAPEVLFDTANGHSFEVDTWSIGVILYTLVVGKPPFQTKDVKEIYVRIRDNQYEFPADRAVSKLVQELIQEILTPNPQERPPLQEIVGHSWFTTGTVPGYIPASAHDAPPDFRHITRPMSETNLARLRKYALLDEDQAAGIAVPSAPPLNEAAAAAKARSVTSNLAQQEKEFQKAVQPGSPISALLSSARQPLMFAPLAPAGARGEQPLLRKLQAAKDTLKSPGRPGRMGLQNIAEELEDEYGARAEVLRKKELESQKARIVAQMVPTSGSAPGSVFGGDDQEQENMPPARTRDAARALKERVQQKAPVPESDRDTEEGEQSPDSVPSGLPLRVSSFDVAAQVLTEALDAKAEGRLFRDPRDDMNLPEQRVFVASWVDYSNRYGTGYILTDGTLGVYYNDSTTIVLAPDRRHFDYITPRHKGAVYVRKFYTVADFPQELRGKVGLLKAFEKYLMGRLYTECSWTFNDLERTKGLDFVQKYLRIEKKAIVFKLSHDVLQFNFYDHTKVVLSSKGLLLTHIDKDYELTRHPLSEIMAQALRPPPTDPEQAKFQRQLLDKVVYIKEVLLSIRQASAESTAQDGEAQEDAGSAQAQAPVRERVSAGAKRERVPVQEARERALLPETRERERAPLSDTRERAMLPEKRERVVLPEKRARAPMPVVNARMSKVLLR